MIFHRLGVINKDQKGFGLAELIVALAITGLITGGITMSIFQVFDINTRSNNHMTAVRQVQNAGYWISHDAQMAQSIDTVDDITTPEEEVLTLGWVGWEYECGSKDTCINTYEVRYTYDAASEKLWRLETITIAQYDSHGCLVDPQPAPQNLTTFIADYITPIPTSTMNDNKLIVTITALVGESEEVRTYEITPRPST